ncbi:MAG: tetratricopeptide repeat protein [Deltaproteobacteria bacterium]|nr:tetratricopeptide repeat protein [Deltaproteobacteria bacterium]
MVQLTPFSSEPRPSALLESSPSQAARAWAAGTATLQELKGYSPEELYLISQQAYTLFLNGKIKDAQVIFEGLLAIDPRNEYYYRALGVIYHRQGDSERAIRQFTHAITVAPRSAAGYVSRAEVCIARREHERALADLLRAIQVGDDRDPVVRKALALRTLLRAYR